MEHKFDNLIRSFERLELGKLINDSWKCDIRSLLMIIIESYLIIYEENESYLETIDLPFYSNISSTRTISDLLQEDLDYLIPPAERVNYPMLDDLYLGEVDFKTPTVTAFSSLKHGKLIAMSQKLIELITVYSMVRELFLLKPQQEKFLKIYETFNSSNVLSELELLSILVNAIKEYYSDISKKDIPFPIDFIHEPFGLCEKVTAIRRFLLAHEIGHFVLGHYLKEMDTNIAELEADRFAIKLCLKRYKKGQLSVKEKCFLESMIEGITSLFALMDFEESFYDYYRENENYPKALVRESLIFESIYYHLVQHHEANPSLFSFLHHSSINNQLFKRVIYQIPFNTYGTTASITMLEKFGKLLAEGFSKDHLAQMFNIDHSELELFNFLSKYSPSNKFKIEDIPYADKIDLLFYYAILFGDEGYGRFTKYLSKSTSLEEFCIEEYYTLLNHRKIIEEQNKKEAGAYSLFVIDHFLKIKLNGEAN